MRSDVVAGCDEGGKAHPAFSLQDDTLMNRKERRYLSKRLRGLSGSAQLRLIAEEVCNGFSWHMTDKEREIACAVGEKPGGPWYHGGPRGFPSGFELRPACETGARPPGFAAHGSNSWDGSTEYAADRKRHVLITTSIEIAEVYRSHGSPGDRQDA